jgi:hypothetical protein
MFIPDPTFFHPGSELSPSLIPGSLILITEFKYFNPKKAKKWFQSSKNMIRVVHPGFRIRMLTFSHSHPSWICNTEWNSLIQENLFGDMLG